MVFKFIKLGKVEVCLSSKSFEKVEKVEKEVKEVKRARLTEYAAANHPCPNCPDNKKDHWDSIHYNCEEHHRMRCAKLLDFNATIDKMFRDHKEKTIKQNND